MMIRSTFVIFLLCTASVAIAADEVVTRGSNLTVDAGNNARLLMDLFGSFGLTLPRNSARQAQAGVTSIGHQQPPSAASAFVEMTPIPTAWPSVRATLPMSSESPLNRAPSIESTM